MQSDPVAEALRAAVDASFAQDGDGVPVPLTVRRIREWRVAHEIAAFLRAPDMNTELMLSGAEGIAAAVERAAKGER